MKRNPAYLLPPDQLAKKVSISMNDQVLRLLKREASRTASNVSQVIRVCVLRTLGGNKAA